MIRSTVVPTGAGSKQELGGSWCSDNKQRGFATDFFVVGRQRAAVEHTDAIRTQQVEHRAGRRRDAIVVVRRPSQPLHLQLRLDHVSGARDGRV